MQHIFIPEYLSRSRCKHLGIYSQFCVCVRKASCENFPDSMCTLEALFRGQLGCKAPRNATRFTAWVTPEKDRFRLRTTESTMWFRFLKTQLLKPLKPFRDNNRAVMEEIRK